MFQWREEGDSVKHGFTFYHPNSTHSIGMFVRVGNHVVRLRWSKHAKRFFTGYNKIDPAALEKQRMWDILNGHE